MKRPRVLIAEDYRLLREMFAKVLEPECDVVGAVADGRALLESASRLRPEIVLLDIAMPLLNGLDAARQLRQVLPEIKVIFLTAIEDAEVAAEAIRVGAAGFVLKNSAALELARAIHDVSQGKTYVTPLVAGPLARILKRESGSEKKPAELSLRQREVLQLLAEGHSMKQVGRLLKISSRTVAFHKYAIMEELGIATSAELVQFAMKQHMVGV